MKLAHLHEAKYAQDPVVERLNALIRRWHEVEMHFIEEFVEGDHVTESLLRYLGPEDRVYMDESDTVLMWDREGFNITYEPKSQGGWICIEGK